MDRLQHLMKRLYELEARILVELDTLRSKEWIGKNEGYGVPTIAYKYGRYLSLVYTVNGQRVEVYVGCDQGKIGDALRGVEVQKRIKVLENRLTLVRDELHKAEIETRLLTFRINDCLQTVDVFPS